ncbi:MAG: hypothetical protein BroJett011_03950 [Chloroflexota bacterium]|nr:MAG: hypothetical protein BroJett011_03950 [Chloroflexota bacterium]
MICPNCGQETKGINHNNRGLRCTGCWTALPLEIPGVVGKMATAQPGPGVQIGAPAGMPPAKTKPAKSKPKGSK